MLNLLEGLCITRVAGVNSFVRGLNPGRRAYTFSTINRLFRFIYDLVKYIHICVYGAFMCVC